MTAKGRGISPRHDLDDLLAEVDEEAVERTRELILVRAGLGLGEPLALGVLRSWGPLGLEETWALGILGPFGPLGLGDPWALGAHWLLGTRQPLGPIRNRDHWHLGGPHIKMWVHSNN